MKQTMLIKAAVALLASAASLGAFADTQSLTVTATVQSVCKFSSAARTLAFDIDPSSTSAAAGVLSGSITYKCTKGVAATGVSAGQGGNWSGSTRQMSTGGATPSLLPYSLTISGDTQTGGGFGTGTDKTLTLTGSVAVADFQNATASTAYTDTVVLTLAP